MNPQAKSLHDLERLFLMMSQRDYLDGRQYRKNNSECLEKLSIKVKNDF